MGNRGGDVGTVHIEPRRPAAAHVPILLPAQAGELRFFFDGYEGEAGLRSSWSSLVQQAMGGDRVPRVDREDESLAGLVDSRVVRRARRVRHAIQRMGDRGEGGYVTVLFRLYGPRAPGSLRTEFGDVAGIVEFTPAVALARRELAADIAARRGKASVAAVSLTVDQIAEAFWLGAPAWHAAERRARRLEAMPATAEQEAQNESRFWRAAGEVQRLESRIAALPEGATDERDTLTTRLVARRAALGRRTAAVRNRIGEHAERARDARAKADALRQHLAGLIAAHRRGLPLIVRRSVERGADAEVTTADAVRWRLDYHGAIGPDGRPNRDAHAAWKADRKIWVDTVRRQAERLRLLAIARYLAALAEVGR